MCLVDLDATGEVTRVEVVRWAGFGLDEATVETVRRLHFFPACATELPFRFACYYATTFANRQSRKKVKG
jgi:outer membrane biosynthesis protein TonB